MEWTELLVLLKTAESAEKLDAHREEITAWMPGLRIMFGFDQRHPAHQYDLWIHTLHVVAELPRGLADDMLYLGALLHDVGKPATATLREVMHYPDHPAVGAGIVSKEILPELEKRGVCLSDEEKRRLLYYVAHHDDMVDFDVKYLKRQKELGADSFERFRNLMYLEVADALAHVQIPVVTRRVEVCGALAGAEGERLWESMEAEESGKFRKRKDT